MRTNGCVVLARVFKNFYYIIRKDIDSRFQKSESISRSHNKVDSSVCPFAALVFVSIREKNSGDSVSPASKPTIESM
jgi:hypothetical protein